MTLLFAPFASAKYGERPRYREQWALTRFGPLASQQSIFALARSMYVRR